MSHVQAGTLDFIEEHCSNIENFNLCFVTGFTGLVLVFVMDHSLAIFQLTRANAFLTLAMGVVYIIYLKTGIESESRRTLKTKATMAKITTYLIMLLSFTIFVLSLVCIGKDTDMVMVPYSTLLLLSSIIIYIWAWHENVNTSTDLYEITDDSQCADDNY